MSNRRSIGFEGCTVKYVKNGIEVMDFFSYLSADKKQNAKSSFVHTWLMLDKLQGGYGLLKRHSGAMFYEQSDGCSAQYTSGTAIKFAILVANRYGIHVNRATTAPQHGKGLVDAQSGFDKAYMRQEYLVSSYDNQLLDNCTLDEKGKHIDPAVVAAARLNDPQRTEGLAGDKRKRKEGQNYFRKKHYIPVNWEENLMPIPGHTYVVDSGFPTDKVRAPDWTQKKPKYRTQPYGGQ
jgi:hypothetical protein